MSVYKEPSTNTWRAVYRYTNWKGEKKQSQKRGFQTKREAQAWEREQLRKGTFDTKCQKCFCVTFAESNKGRRFAAKGGFDFEKDNQCHGGKRFSQSQQQKISG